MESKKRTLKTFFPLPLTGIILCSDNTHRVFFEARGLVVRRQLGAGALSKKVLI